MNAVWQWAKAHDVFIFAYGAWLVTLTVVAVAGWPWDW